MDNFFIAIRHSTQHSDRGWNRTSVAIIILISTPPLPTQPMSGCNTPPGICPLLFKKSSVGSFTSLKNQTSERSWDRDYDFSSLSKKTRMMSQQR